MKRIGVHFAQEVEAANLGGMPFSWGDDGRIEFGPSMKADEIAAVQAVYEAHDPSEVTPNE